MAVIDSKVEIWKNKLLDMGKRNRLLNYKDTSKSALKITYPEYLELYQMLVNDEMELIFPKQAEEKVKSENEQAVENTDAKTTESSYVFPESDEEIDDEINDGSNIKANKTGAELQRTLRNLRNKAKTALEEQGINMLYLSFGFLKWTESAHSSVEYSAPLILVPVSLTIESITAPYTLKLHEDEIVLNPTLCYKLENEFGLTLPNYDNYDNLSSFFDDVKSIVAVNGWNVITDVGLSLLSFLKINMYEDLSKHKETIISNPVVRAIGGEPSGLPTIPEGIDSYDFDKNDKPSDIFQIVDADASQQEAILLAKKGASFILQGPPGTGKSQTITNIIAECLADGKKVLFVSEKMAALEVVHKRLSSAGLDDFCLVLHSYKANKRNVLDQLEKVLMLSQKKATLTDEAYQKLNTLMIDKQKLNDYAEQIFTKIEPLGKTIYEANGIIANLESYPDLIFAIPDIQDTSFEKYNNLLHYISQFAITIGKMTDDYKTNPWRDANLKTVTMEFRHDASANLAVLSPRVNDANHEIQRIYNELQIELPVSLISIKKVISLSSLLNHSYKVPSEWIIDENSLPLLSDVEKNIESQNKCISLIEQVKTVIAPAIGNNLVSNFANDYLYHKDNVVLLMNTLQKILSENTPFAIWNAADFNSITDTLVAAKNVSSDINADISELLEAYESSVLDIDFVPIRGRIKTDYTSFTKVFKKEYKEDRKSIQVHRREIVKKISDEEMFSVVEKLFSISEKRKWFDENAKILNKFFGESLTSEKTDFTKIDSDITVFVSLQKTISLLSELLKLYDSISQTEELIREKYSFLYSGLSTDWEYIKQALTWSVNFKNAVVIVNPGMSFIQNVCSSTDFAIKCCNRLSDIQNITESLGYELSWFINCFDDKTELFNTSFDELYLRIDACRNNLSLLEEWIDFRNARENCISNGLESFVKAIADNNLKSQDILPIFKKRFFRLWLDAVMPDYPAVLNFRRKQQEMLIDEFASLDTIQFEIAKARIKGKLVNALPTLDHFTSGVDEISILKRELKKQRKIMPIRKLFKAIPNLLLTLKPCLMMSPLSVSLFLEADSYKFDIVIFDEASQVYTENAIGAISRGKQVVIAGDSKQLPPTSFFQSAVSDNDSFDSSDDDEEFYDTDMYDSILDEANMLPERTLKWHYRSRHESLIAFSNSKIYKNRLVTFPSNFEKVKDNGVEYVYVPEGFYDRGGKKGNVIEAQKVAELVFQHFRDNPSRSLGVIAFGEVQQNAIEAALRELRLQNQEMEMFFSEENENPFFVKSLENVQGDERDTIIFSIGYAKDASGVFRMQFGPLGKSGGERRLNVAITRAKYNIKLVGSIMPTDINVDSISTEGPKLLRAYIDYAINGSSVLNNDIIDNDIVEHDSPFEESVYRFLEKNGYNLSTQVGCSGYRIDMAVKHPTISGVYVIGIECDGASYHSSRTARERDRLRQDVLENMGWTIYRIWSTDWIKDPISEGQKLVNAIENAIRSFGDDSYDEEEQPTIGDFVAIEDKTEEDYNLAKVYGFVSKSQYSFSSLPKNAYGFLDAKDCIELIVKNEFPVHYEIVCQRMAGLYGNEKATVKIRREVDYNLRYLGDRVLRKGDFLYPVDFSSIPIRLPNERKIQHISTDELETAMLSILRTCVGTTRDAICAETARVYGFQRVGPNISSAMTEALVNLINKSLIEEVEGKIKIVQ